MKKISKLVLGLTSMGTVIAPLAATVSCGASSDYSNNVPSVVADVENGTAKLSGVWGATDGGNIQDQSFNNQAFDAVLSVSGKASNFIATASMDSSAIETSYRTAIAGQADVIVASGFSHGDAIESVLPTPEFKDKGFIFLDAPLDSSDSKRVLNIRFDTVQVGFEAGYSAALYASANPGDDNKAKIATFGGVDISPVTDYMFGFVQGLKFWNSNNASATVELVKPSATFMGGFGSEGGKTGNLVTQTANELIDGGVDVIFPVGGPQQATVATAIKTKATDPKLANVRVIGVDADYKKQAAPELAKFVLNSALKNIATVTTAALEVIYNLDAKGQTSIENKLPAHYAKPVDETRGLFKNNTFGFSVSGGLNEKFVGISDESTLTTNTDPDAQGYKDDVKKVIDAASKAVVPSGTYVSYATTDSNWK